MTTSTRRREERLEVRLSSGAKQLMQRAADAQRKTLSAFVLESGVTAAAEALADRRSFELPAEAYDAFAAALEMPKTSKPRLEKLLTSPSVLEPKSVLESPVLE
ncbi:MAG: DUF1778 domain-containing protein [Proteobacteria bacterium]|nr:DUF1778 domain-containing protein [Pseudomonadota bacterium]